MKIHNTAKGDSAMKLSKEEVAELNNRVTDIIFKVVSNGKYSLEDLSLTLPALVDMASSIDIRIWKCLTANYDPEGSVVAICRKLLEEYKGGHRFAEYIIDYLFFMMLQEFKKRKEVSPALKERDRMASFYSKLNLQGAA